MEHGGGAVDLLSVFHTVDETGSTNADLITAAANGAPEGHWLRAERQSGGRGRQGRIWQSPLGNLYASTIVRLEVGDPLATSLSLLAGVVLAKTVNRLGIHAVLKWPNDLLIGRAKVAGILLERVGDAVVIGFGVNVRQHPLLPDRPTTSLAEHGVTTTPLVLLESLANQLTWWLRRWRDEGVAPVLVCWQELAHAIGTELRVALPDQTVLSGAFAGLDLTGALLLKTLDGTTHVIHSADVFTH